MKSILNIKGVQKLDKNQQSKVKAGGFCDSFCGSPTHLLGGIGGAITGWACVCEKR
ncbi:hypothetical protein [Aquimarina macrocephali]|uniref:hypothetical protein n=1 Tax=Aquimarina macrocephali TaxID=666563 RepID=UPI003F67B071